MRALRLILITATLAITIAVGAHLVQRSDAGELRRMPARRVRLCRHAGSAVRLLAFHEALRASSHHVLCVVEVRSRARILLAVLLLVILSVSPI